MTWVRQHRSVAAWLFAAALLLRVLVPTGWMPAASAQGWTVTLCSGAGPAIVDLGGNPVHAPESQDAPCAFGALASSADVPGAVALPSPPASSPEVPPAFAVTPSAATIVVRGQPSTGPPVSS